MPDLDELGMIRKAGESDIYIILYFNTLASSTSG